MISKGEVQGIARAVYKHVREVTMPLKEQIAALEAKLANLEALVAREDRRDARIRAAAEEGRRRAMALQNAPKGEPMEATNDQ
jgi:hypothetical protein